MSLQGLLIRDPAVSVALISQGPLRETLRGQGCGEMVLT